MAAAATTPPPQEQQQEQPQQPPAVVLHRLRAVPLTPSTFAPYGRVIGAADDGTPFSREEQTLPLDLSQGPPRLYMMRLPERGRRFHRITFHARVTQCLGVVQPGVPWYLAVAKPTGSAARFPRPQDVAAFRIPHGVLVRLHAATWHAGPLFDGGFALGPPPRDAEEACARAMERGGEVGVPGGREGGAKGGGVGGGGGEGGIGSAKTPPPLSLDFFNLELSDTNVTDHNTHDYSLSGDGVGAASGVVFEVVDD
jgi:hypothetical protein